MNAEKIKELVKTMDSGAWGHIKDSARIECLAAIDTLQAERDVLADKLDISVHGHNQMFDLCQEAIAERDTLRQKLEAAQKDAKDFAEYYLSSRSPLGSSDWACKDCHPNSDILVEGFVCVVHRAIAATKTN